jgi:uncharacterized membrane protein YccC
MTQTEPSSRGNTPTALLDWLRARDPGFASMRRAARVTLVACFGFYACQYGLHNSVMATYALFGAFALGALSQIAGGPPERALTLIAVLPVGWALVALGTLLSVSNETAAAGMFVLGFLVSYVGVGGPRLTGLAAGGQLLYILPCFPPYDPASLPARLAGLTLAVLLLAGAELTLWPDAAPVRYERRLADALEALVGCLKAVADSWSGDKSARSRLAALLPGAIEKADALRPSKLPRPQRPASAGRYDRALSQAASTERLLLGRTVDLFFADDHETRGVAAAQTLLRHAASRVAAAAAWLRGEGPAPSADRSEAAEREFQVARFAISPDEVPPEQLRLGSLALSVGEWTKTLVTAVRIAAGAPIEPDATPPSARPGPFWYAYPSAAALYWHRLREHLTPRSVYFQGALRLAIALALARFLAGALDLSHGFWVLLATLTLMRTSAAETRSALRPVLVGTLIGSLIAAAALVVVAEPRIFVFVLPVVMLVGLAAGPLLGPGWAQGLFTIVIALVFAQIAPTDWRIATTRVMDVAVGAAIGVLIGVFAWPRGGSGELHRATANFLSACADVVRETVAVLAEGAAPGHALPRARALGQLAEACYALYQSERHGPTRLDWQATLAAGHHAVRGAEALLRSDANGAALDCAAPLTVTAADVAARFESVAKDLLAGRRPLDAAFLSSPLVTWPTHIGLALYHLADIRVWLDGLRDDLDRILDAPSAPQSEPESLALLRLRVLAVADGSSD